MNTLTATGFFLFPAAIIGLPLLIVGSRLLFIALYRVRHGNQPHCRKCDYQLTGMTTEQTCCPECGGNLRSAKAIVKGTRQTNNPLIFTSIIMVLIASGLLGKSAHVFHTTNQWIKYKPTAWLINDAIREFNGPVKRNTKELITRYTNLKISDDRLAELSEKTVKLQTQSITSWKKNAFWPMILDSLVEDRLLTQQQMQHLITKNFTLELMAKPTHPRQKSFTCKTHEQTLLQSKSLQFSYQRVLRQITANDQLLKEIKQDDTRYTPQSNHTGYYYYSLDMDKPPFSQIPDGVVQLNFKQQLNVRIDSPHGYEPFTITETHSRPLKIIPANAKADTFITDEKFNKSMDQAWHRTRVIQTSKQTSVWGELENIPLNLAMAVILIDQDKRHYAGNLLINEVLPKKWYMAHTKRNYKLSGQVKVLLEPSQHVANRHMNLATYWGKPLQRENIKINAPYDPPFDMDQSIADEMAQSYTIQVGKRHSNKSLKLTVHYLTAPACVNYILMAKINDDWRQVYRYPFKTRGRPGHNYRRRIATYQLVEPDLKHITF
ncbi:MAG: hypothetical protein CMJ19_17860 [Phycisphaeraceae bacterium]|nr:hypothetical protein [Phycisphaeraceae bacterium]